MIKLASIQPPIPAPRGEDKLGFTPSEGAEQQVPLNHPFGLASPHGYHKMKGPALALPACAYRFAYVGFYPTATSKENGAERFPYWTLLPFSTDIGPASFPHLKDPPPAKKTTNLASPWPRRPIDRAYRRHRHPLGPCWSLVQLFWEPTLVTGDRAVSLLE